MRGSKQLLAALGDARVRTGDNEGALEARAVGPMFGLWSEGGGGV